MRTFLRILIIITSLFLLGVGIVLYFVYNAGSENMEVLEERSYEETIEKVEIRLENARLEIRPSPDETTRLVLSGNDDDFQMNAEAVGGSLAIEIKDRSPFFNFDFNRSYSVQIFVPAGGLSSLAANSDNGRIDVNGITVDQLMLRTNNGRIALDAVDSETIDAETDNGRIEMNNIEAAISARSSNGRLLFSDVSGELEARANNGRIELETEMLEFPVAFDTDNGRIEIRTDTEPVNARIEVRTGNGSIDIYGRDNEETVFGSGEALIRLASNNGSITVE
ncbi:DUF4097 family beta strand repeat-containing protein [Planococcus sp. SIMBA_160]